MSADVLATCSPLNALEIFLQAFILWFAPVLTPEPITPLAPTAIPLAIAPAKNPNPCIPWSAQKFAVPKDLTNP